MPPRKTRSTTRTVKRRKGTKNNEEAKSTSVVSSASRPRRKWAHYSVPRQKNPFLSRTLGKPFESPNSIATTFEIFSFNERKNLICRIETRGDQKCPFCAFPAGSSKRLFKHCRRFHSDHHFFTSVKAEDGALYIFCKPIHLADSCGSLSSPRNYQFFRFRSPTGKKKRIKMKPYSIDAVGNSIKSLLSKEQQSAVTPAQSPDRQYYHSRSRIPMQPGEWAIDSDDESDNEWLDELAEAGLKEFVDINAEEKRFLDLWKRFIRSDAVVVDEGIPDKCLEFIKVHINELKGLRQQLLMHLLVLWEHRLMPSSHILVCMAEYDSVHNVENVRKRKKVT